MAKSDYPIVVCDAGPLIHLDEIGCLDLLEDFDQVLVPRAVWTEVRRHRPAIETVHIPHAARVLHRAEALDRNPGPWQHVSMLQLQPWLVYALLSAVAAALVGIFGKIGMRDVDSNLATAVRSIVMTIFLLGVCQSMSIWSRIGGINGKALGMIVLSGVAGAVSWLFYFKAIQVGTVAQVAPIDKLSMPLAVLLAVILLGDRPSIINWSGIALIAFGAILAAIPAR